MSKDKNKSIWLVGASGMLGRELSAQLDQAGLPHYSTDIECDITEMASVEQFLSDKSNIKWIINCAAYTAVDKAEDEEDIAYQLNAIGPRNLAVVSSRIGATLVHISTDYVFDGINANGYSEDDKVNPISAYGRTKAAGEKYIQEFCDKYYIIRTAWLYGKYGNNFVYTMLRLMNEKDEIQVVNDQHGSPTHALDLAKFIRKLINSDQAYGIFHYTNLGNITWYEFAVEIYKQGKEIGLINSNCLIKPVDSTFFMQKASRPKYSYLLKGKEVYNFLQSWKVSLDFFLRGTTL